MNRPPFLVEFVGPAGAGKTTLVKALSARNKNYRIVNLPRATDPKGLAFLAPNFARLLPVLLSSYRAGNTRRFASREVVVMAIVQGWGRALKRPTANYPDIILLDQGPVNLLGHLDAWGSLKQSNPQLKTWYARMCASWASTLDLVVLVDASNEVLAHRISTREQEHGLKDWSVEDSSRVLNKFRDAYQHVLAAMPAETIQKKVICLDSTQASADQIYQEAASVIARRMVSESR